MSVALGDPDLFTNALVNQYLPFVVDWDTMTKKEKEEMLDFWGALQGGHPLRNYTYLFRLGIFAPEYLHMHITWSIKDQGWRTLLRVGTRHSQSRRCRVGEGGC